MTRLQGLYQQLINQNRSEIEGWREAYKELTGDVAQIRKAIKNGFHLENPKVYVGTNFENEKNRFEAFAEELIFAKNNGVSSRGQSVLARVDFEQFIANKAFVLALEALIREPSPETFKAFRARWLSFGKGNRPVLVNRTLAACTTAVATTVDESKFENVYWWLINEGLIMAPESPAADWYAKNLHLVSQLRERLRNDQMPETKDEHFVNIFLWELFTFTNMKNQMIETLVALLESNKQIVLTGAPGTGKTFVARQLAAKLLNCPVEALANEKHQNRFGFVQFHSAYDYTDFVEGLKPEKDAGGQITFKLRNGIFRDFCEKAKNQEGKCLFVIDEINRADPSRVFGELFYALEPDYRGKGGRVLTQYASLRPESDKYFYVPENVFIIGTMNDIDRSVESIDFALRRRFAWYEVQADDERFDAVMQDVLTDKPDLKKKAKDRYQELNGRIAEQEELGSSYKIGPTYFRKLESYKDQDEPDLWNIFWQRHLGLLIREYVRGMPNPEEQIKKFRDAYDQNSAPSKQN
jgi:5-methylcytosine-specific restriction enzyme B